MRRRTALLASAALVVSILLLTLWPLPEQAYRASLSPISCLVCGDQGMQDVIQNVIMFLPLGLMLGLAGVRPGRAALAALGLALLIETLQYFVIPGRDASVSDVLTNTAGAALGAFLAPHLPTLLRPSRQAATIFACAAVLSWAGAWLFGAWAIEADPGRGGWRGRLANELPDAAPFNGEVVAAFLDGAPLGVTPTALPPEVEQAFARDSFVLEGSVRPGPAIASRENIVTVIDTPREGGNTPGSLVMVFNRASTRGIIAFRQKAARLRLRTFAFPLGHLFNVPVDEEVRFRVSRVGGTIRGIAQGSGPDFSTEYRLGPELLWSVMAPRTPQPTPWWRFEAFLWAAGLLGAAGYSASRSARPVALLAGAGAVALMVQLLTPRYFPVAPQSALGWIMLMSGLVIGAIIGRRADSASLLTPHD